MANRVAGVFLPAPEILRQLLESIIHEYKPAPAGQFPQPIFGRLECFIRPTDFLTVEGEVEERGLVGRSDLAFGHVHLEF